MTDSPTRPAPLAVGDKAIADLTEAVWQVLDDMGDDWFSCCPSTKAKLRVAFEPFMQAEILSDPSLADGWAPDYPLEDAIALLKGLE